MKEVGRCRELSQELIDKIEEGKIPKIVDLSDIVERLQEGDTDD